MDEREQKLKDFQTRLKAHYANEETFLGFPDSWYDDHVWICPNAHAGTMYLKSEALGAAVCLNCHEPVYMFPASLTPEQLQQALK